MKKVLKAFQFRIKESQNSDCFAVGFAFNRDKKFGPKLGSIGFRAYK